MLSTINGIIIIRLQEIETIPVLYVLDAAAAAMQPSEQYFPPDFDVYHLLLSGVLHQSHLTMVSLLTIIFPDRSSDIFPNPIQNFVSTNKDFLLFVDSKELIETGSSVC